MSYPQYTIALMGGLGWSFWPYGDVYSLVPKWDEWHAPSGEVTSADEESNRLELVGKWNAPETFFTLYIADETDPTLPVVPAVTPVFSSRVWKDFGWQSDERSFDIAWVQDDITLAWTGDVKVSISSALKTWIGVNNLVRFAIDWWPSTTPNDIMRTAYGTLVLRP